MKKTIIITLLIELAFLANAQYQINTTEKGDGFYLNPDFCRRLPRSEFIAGGR